MRLNLFVCFILVAALIHGCKSASEIVPIPTRQNAELENPKVAARDPASIVLSRVHIAEHAVRQSSCPVAVLVRMQSNVANAENDAWVLAYVEKGVRNGDNLSIKNLIIWSGLVDPNGSLQIKLVDLNKLNKEKIDQYAELTKKFIGFVPVYGEPLKEAVAAAQAINRAQPNQYTLIEPTLGFIPSAPLHYGHYLATTQEALELSPSLYYDTGSLLPLVRDSNNLPLDENYVVLEVSKGELRSFELSRKDSADELLELANQTTFDQTPDEIKAQLKTLTDAATSFASSSSVASIAKSTDYRDLVGIREQLLKLKSLGDMIVTKDSQRLIRSIASYFDPSVRPDSDQVDPWLSLVNEFINARAAYDPKTTRFQKP